jgi:hypothetical protein
MKRTAAAFATLVLFACASSAPATKSGPETFQAKLDAANEVPPPSLSGTSPSGTATFTHEGNSIAYTVNVSGLSSPLTVAHIHVGPPGVAGPVVVPLNLTPGPTEGTAVGEGSFDASAIKGKNADGSPMTMADLLTAMRNGGTYINVHTVNNKPGETRGQIQP